jgi:hypothetical protein
MTLPLNRRSFMTGIGATTASAVLAPAPAIAGEASTIPTYRTAIDLIDALAARQISARELLDAAIARIDSMKKSMLSSCATSIGRVPPQMQPMSH